MPKRKKSLKRLTPQQAVEVQAAVQAVAAKIHDDRKTLAETLRPIVSVIEAVRHVRGIRALDDVAVPDVAAMATGIHAALQKSEGRATGKRGGRPTKSLPDLATLKAQHPTWNKKKQAHELHVSQRTLNRRSKKDRS